MHILMMIGELMRCVGVLGGRAGEDLVWGGPLCVYVVLCGLVKKIQRKYRCVSFD